MILFLRNKENKTILEVEIYVKSGDVRDYVELNSTVMIEPYSRFLLENLDIPNQIISTFADLSELRGWMWENYFMVKDNKPSEIDNVAAEVRKMLKEVATDFDLYYTED